MDTDGDFVVTWSSFGQDGSGDGVYAQRYNKDGVTQGSEFRINTTTSGNQRYSTVAMDASGDFVVTWSSFGQDGSGWGVYAQRYNAAGVAQGSEFRVNTTTTNAQVFSTVAMDTSGDFVVTWSSNAPGGSGYEVYAQRYNAAGVTQGSEFRVNTTTNGNQQYSTVAMDADGDFVVTWSSYAQDGSGWGVYAQRYNQDGEAKGSEFRVNTTTTNAQLYSTVAMDTNGDFVVTWSSPDGSGFGVYARRYNADGTPAPEGEFRVNTTTTGDQRYSTIAMDADGDFIITWSSVGQDGSNSGVYARRYNADGTATPEGEFRVNTYTTSNQHYSSVAMDASGNFVVDWSSAGQDGSGDGVYSQLYQGDAPVLDLNGPTSGINYAATFTEDGGAAVIVDSTNLTLSDVDHTTLNRATVTITNPLDGTAEALAATTTGTNITATYSAGTGVLSLEGIDTLAHYQQVLRSVTYNNTSQNPDTTPRNISFVVNAGATNSAVATTTLTVNAVNDPPILDLEGSASGINYAASFTENGGAVAVVNSSNLSLSDVDNTTVNSATVTITNLLDGAAEALAATTTGTNITATYSSGTGVLALNGTATLGEYQQVLRTVTYNNTSQSPNTTARNISFVVNDGAATTAVATTTLTVNAVNDAPTVGNVIPNQSATEDSLFSVIIPANTFNDVDAGDILTYTATLSNNDPLPSWLSFDPTTRTLSGIPDNENVGSLGIKVTATDTAGATVSSSFNLAIANTNDAPTVGNAIADHKTPAGVPFSFTFADNTFNDVDTGDSLTYTATLSNSNPLPNWLSFNPTTHTFSGTPATENVGYLAITVTATDTAGTTVSDTFNLAIQNTLNGTSGANTLVGTAFDDIINANGGNDVINGNGGDDVIDGGLGNDNVSGGDGHDTLIGNTGNDRLAGNAGDDFLTGGAGKDTLTGGLGDDQLIYTALGDKGDTIADFSNGNDVLVLSTLFANLGYSSTDPIAEGYISLTQSGINTQVLVYDETSASSYSTLVTLNNFSAANLVLGSNLIV